MGKVPRRVLLLASQPLLGEGLAEILRRLPEVELNGPWRLEVNEVPEAALTMADAVVLATDGEDPGTMQALVARILDHFPNLPVLRVSAAQDRIWLYRSETFASGSDTLVHLLGSLLGKPRQGIQSEQKESSR